MVEIGKIFLDWKFLLVLVWDKIGKEYRVVDGVVRWRVSNWVEGVLYLYSF